MKRTKVEIPYDIQVAMTKWRNGFEFPQSYIDFHKGLAEQALEELKEKGYCIHNQYMASDGWGDGMKALHAVVEYKNELMKIHWHDGNQEFFYNYPSGGSSPLRLKEMRED